MSNVVSVSLKSGWSPPRANQKGKWSTSATANDSDGNHCFVDVYSKFADCLGKLEGGAGAAYQLHDALIKNLPDGHKVYSVFFQHLKPVDSSTPLSKSEPKIEGDAARVREFMDSEELNDELHSILRHRIFLHVGLPGAEWYGSCHTEEDLARIPDYVVEHLSNVAKDKRRQLYREYKAFMTQSASVPKSYGEWLQSRQAELLSKQESNPKIFPFVPQW